MHHWYYINVSAWECKRAEAVVASAMVAELSQNFVALTLDIKAV